jgi:SAM-dependent methyltransferase
VNETHIQFLSSPEWAQMLEVDLLPWIESVGDLGHEVLEVGPGPGLTTDLLRVRVSALTAVEVDAGLAEALAQRLVGTNVTVINADARDAGLPADHFSAAACFSMLHHLPSQEAQDAVFGEIHRVLRPGGMFFGVDSADLQPIRDGHAGDTFVPLDPDTLGARFAAAGLTDLSLERGEYQIRFVARKAE